MKRTINATYFTFLVACFFLAGFVAVSGAHAQDSESKTNKWQFEFTPYFMAAAMNGETGVGGVTTDIDMSFEDIWNNLDLGLMGIFEARRGNWIFAIDAVYFRLKDEKTGSWTGPKNKVTVDAGLEATLVQQIYQGTVGYRVIDSKNKLDFTGGVRYTMVDNEFKLSYTTSTELFPGDKRKLSFSEGWADPVFGVRFIAPFSKQWSFFGYGDIGGFSLGSRITYQGIAGLRWQFSRVVSAKLAYRYLYQDFEDDDFVWDMVYQGPLLGFGFTF